MLGLILVSTAAAAETSFHAAGYGFAGLDVPIDGDAPAFTTVGFNPIFLWRAGGPILGAESRKAARGTPFPGSWNRCGGLL